jgi:hypothetical protein
LHRVFSTSVFFLVHAWTPIVILPILPRLVSNVDLPPELEHLDGRERVDAVKCVLGVVVSTPSV